MSNDYFGPPAEAFKRNRMRKLTPFSYDHLFVFKALRTLKEEFDRDKALDSIPRNIKYSLVNKTREELLEIEVLIYTSYDTKDNNEKITFLQQAWQCILKVRSRFRSLYLKKLINDKRMVLYATLVDDVAMQLKGWLNHTISSKLKIEQSLKG